MEALTFFLGNEKFAIDITLVNAIENMIPLTPVPKAEIYVKGLINMRGSVLPVVDIGMLMTKKNYNENFEKLIIIDLNNAKIALAITTVDDVLNVEDEKVELIDKAKELFVINNNTEIITLITKKYLSNI